MNARTLKRIPRRLGVSMLELLIALAIAVSLLTAAAVAFTASSNVVSANDEFSRATQAARISMLQVLTQVRRGSVNQTWDSHTLRLVTGTSEDGSSGGDDVTYSYVPGTKKLMLITNDDATDTNFTLASNISDMTFDVELGQDYTHAPCVVRVTVYITVQVGNNVVKLSGAAAPRRNLVY